MGWVRVDDAFYDHPKFYEVNAIGVALWVSSLAYANRNLTDGFIPESALPRLVNLDGVDVGDGMYGRGALADDGAAQLIAAGIWEAEERGYRIVNYLEFQPSADEVKAKREQNALRQAQFKRRRSGNAVSNAVSDAATNAEVTHAPNPNPKPMKVKSETRASALPADFAPTDEQRQWAATVVRASQIDTETQKFIDHFTATGKAMKDWNAAWRNWIRRSREFDRQAPSDFRPAVVGAVNSRAI